MFRILQNTLRTGIVTGNYPPPAASLRGKPEFDFESWTDARPASDVCPTGAIIHYDRGAERTVTIDYGRCVFCGLCEGESVRITREFELATHARERLVTIAKYRLNEDGTHEALLEVTTGDEGSARNAIHELLGRSLAIRQVDAGSCNGCELEITGLTAPQYDLERFGIHFVASPRHADCLLVTGPVTRNMAEALRRTWQATPDPKFVIAVGDCGRDGGLFRGSYAIVGGVADVLPVDAVIPGCPPSPAALLAGLLEAIGRLTR
jgi:Ni,Fe-hydrogenase III small subunit/formate hydrogenlyase subunit 6/NADH:ubiquinone oxidoreductase subunit I